MPSLIPYAVYIGGSHRLASLRTEVDGIARIIAKRDVLRSKASQNFRLSTKCNTYLESDIQLASPGASLEHSFLYSPQHPKTFDQH